MGSSPLTRGKPRLGCPGWRKRRLIPAHAGKTAQAHATPSWKPAHPRSRGENRPGTSSGMPSIGSSPLTRGKLTRFHGRIFAQGLIPAHAGKTRGSSVFYVYHWAHPRSRGENNVSAPEMTVMMGSSPLTRGKRRLASMLAARCRLIPAHAGKTRSCTRRTRGRWAHPRSRGENGHRKPAAHDEPGSSPLTRGKPFTLNSPMSIARLIPAHAGKTAGCGPRATPPGAHPRSRGENSTVAVASRVWPGSSPLTRGKLQPAPRAERLAGLIPAHAGKTS